MDGGVVADLRGPNSNAEARRLSAHYDAHMPLHSPGEPEIKVLEGLEAVRRRPALYIGDPRDPATLVRLVAETASIAASQLVLGQATQVTIVLGREEVRVEDDGPGLPVILTKNGQRAAELLCSVISGHFLPKELWDLGARFGLYGIVVTNALSEFLEVDFVTDGEAWFQRYERGRALAPMASRGPSSRRGTTIRFQFDRSIVVDAPVAVDALRERFDEHPEVRGRIAIVDAR